MKSPPLRIPLLASLLCCLPSAFSQNPTAPAAATEAGSLEQVPEKLQKLDDDIAKKLEEVRALVESEAAAKRLTEPIAQSLRWSLRTTATVGLAVDVRGIVSTMRVPTENGALTQAIKELEATYAAAQARRTVLAGEAAREVRRRVAESVRTATKPADLQALETTLTSAREALQRRAGLLGNDSTTAFGGADQLLRGLRRLMQAEMAGKPQALGQAMKQIRNDNLYDQAAAYESEVQARLDRLTQPFSAAAETAEGETAAAILERKPPAEIDAALARFDEAAERLSHMGTGQYAQRDPRPMATAYRNLARAMEGLGESGEENIQTRVNEARNAARQLGGKRAAEMEAMIAKLETQFAEAAAKMASERSEKLPARITAVKQPSDLDAIVADLRRWSASARQSNGGVRDNWNALATQLSTLSASWATASPALLQQNRYGENENARAGYAGELVELRKRIERDVLSRALEAPELHAPPLAAKPVEAALDAFCDDLVKAGAWRRLYEVLSARNTIQGNSGRHTEDDALAALRSFFTAQNLELAEEWLEAAQAYKLVLRSASRRAPIQPAADRLKALVKEHPEAAATRPAPAGQ